MKNSKKTGRIFLITCLLMAFIGKVNGQISPGDLSTAHANLEGMTKCVQCHVLGESVTNEKCLDCHKEMKQLIQQKRGYHVSVEVEGKNCLECHNEHHGRNFALVKFDKDQFDHQLAGYELKGKHKQIDCNECHKDQFIQKKISQKKDFSYLGLETNCTACHTDRHGESLGNDCAKCHNFDAFKPAEGFDHQKTDFALVGKHARVECKKCHEQEIIKKDTIQRFTREVPNSCTVCHEDIHKGKFGKNCLECHNQESFHQVSNLNDFDHTKTNFPLLGQHQAVKCAACHTKAYTLAVKHANCTDCHTDYHKGQFTVRGKTSDCNQCHTVNGYTPSLFTIEQHNEGDFKLEGAHLATPCIFCHKKEVEWSFRNIGKMCVDCHQDIHKVEMSSKYYPEQRCENCHSISAWDEVKFDHNLTEFKLEGKHADQTCRKCHFTEANNDSFSQKFSSLDQSCTQCHIDEHQGQFETDGKNLCERCHQFNNWEPTKFNHAETRFKLDGGHEGVECFKCHVDKIENGKSYSNYQFTDIRCAVCHTP
ncbi:MAG: hypothetical protein ACERKD_07185 [Prolixibacteraceae bacterium]